MKRFLTCLRHWHAALPADSLRSLRAGGGTAQRYGSRSKRRRSSWHHQLGTPRTELRIESFNLLNHFNRGNPATKFNAGTFGRITTQAGVPRIIQLGVKYAF